MKVYCAGCSKLMGRRNGTYCQDCKRFMRYTMIAAEVVQIIQNQEAIAEIERMGKIFTEMLNAAMGRDLLP